MRPKGFVRHLRGRRMFFLEHRPPAWFDLIRTDPGRNPGSVSQKNGYKESLSMNEKVTRLLELISEDREFSVRAGEAKTAGEIITLAGEKGIGL